MLKTSQGNKLNTRQSTERPRNTVGHPPAPMPDHLSDKMLQRNPHGLLQKQHSSSDYNFMAGTRGTPTAPAASTHNHQRFSNNNMTHFQKYKLQKQRESASGPRKLGPGNARQHSRANDRGSQHLTDVLPRHNSQALAVQQAINNKQTVSQ